MLKLKCEKCGDIDSCQIDGYNWAERVLEGVFFKVSIPDGKKVVIAVLPECSEYFDTLNTKRLLKQGVDFVHDAVGDCLDGKCPKCGEYSVDVIDTDAKPPAAPATPPKKIALTRGPDILKQLGL